jgi:hypothetical protein
MRRLRHYRLGQARAAQRHMTPRTARQPRAPEPGTPGWLADDGLDRDYEDVINLGGIFNRDYSSLPFTAVERLIPRWHASIRAPSARTHAYAVGGALGGAIIVIIALLGIIRPGGPPGTGAAGCAALSHARQLSASDYQRIRAQFAGTQWPDLRLAGTSYIDLLVALRTARGTDGYEAVWFYQRLALACARHGSKMRIPGAMARRSHRADASRSACPTWRPRGESASPPARACSPTQRASTRRSARCRPRGSGLGCTAWLPVSWSGSSRNSCSSRSASGASFRAESRGPYASHSREHGRIRSPERAVRPAMCSLRARFGTVTCDGFTTSRAARRDRDKAVLVIGVRSHSDGRCWRDQHRARPVGAVMANPPDLARDLRAVGAPVSDVWELVNAKTRYTAAIPVLALASRDAAARGHD